MVRSWPQPRSRVSGCSYRGGACCPRFGFPGTLTLSVPGGYSVVPEPPVRRLTGWASEGLGGGADEVRALVLLRSRPSRSRRRRGRRLARPGDAEIKEAGAHV